MIDRANARRASSACLFLCGFAACTAMVAPGAPVVPTARAAAPAPLPFADELLAVAAAYPQWERVSDRANFAPTDCRIPAPAGVLRSEAMDLDQHGRKLYFLFAKDGTHYHMMTTGNGPVPVGQAIVKQSFHAREVPPESVPKLAGDGRPFARKVPAEYRFEGERAFRTGEPFGLFVMLKMAPDTPGTDGGWVYGTLTPDGKQVTASGQLTSCIACHRQAPHERLFGMYRNRR